MCNGEEKKSEEKSETENSQEENQEESQKESQEENSQEEEEESQEEKAQVVSELAGKRASSRRIGNNTLPPRQNTSGIASCITGGFRPRRNLPFFCAPGLDRGAGKRAGGLVGRAIKREDGEAEGEEAVKAAGSWG